MPEPSARRRIVDSTQIQALHGGGSEFAVELHLRIGQAQGAQFVVAVGLLVSTVPPEHRLAGFLEIHLLGAAYCNC